MSGLKPGLQHESDEANRRNVEWPKPERFLRNPNLALVGFPNSVQSFNIACFRQYPAFKPRQFLTREEFIKSRVTMETQGGCRRSGQLPYLGGDTGREGSYSCECISDDRCSIDPPDGASQVHTCGETDMKIHRGAGEREHQERIPSPPSKQLKFGIEAILAIGNKESEKKYDEHPGNKHLIVLLQKYTVSYPIPDFIHISVLIYTHLVIII